MIVMTVKLNEIKPNKIIHLCMQSHKSTLLPLEEKEETKTLIVGLDCYI